LGTPLLEQLACSWLLEMPHVLPPRREMLKARRDMCEALMAEYFPRWRFTPPEGGLSLGGTP
jgi:DNA-binding transcriptional MocR family regulator